MKHLLVKLAACLFLWTSLAGTAATACTIFVFTYQGKTYFCNNEDWRDPVTQIRFIPAKEGNYAWVYFGFSNDWAQGGVNEHGLCFDWFAGGGPFGWKSDPAKLNFDGNLSEELLRKCKNVDEAIEFYQRYNEENLENAVTLIADKAGNSLLVHWKDGRLVLEKNVEHLHSCGVGKQKVDTRLQNPGAGLPLSMLTDALRASATEGEFATKYSSVISLSDGKILLYQERKYDQYLEIDIARRLQQPASTFLIADLFQVKEPRPGIELKHGAESDLFADEPTAAVLADRKAIRETLIDYIDGSTKGQPERLKSAFHPELNLYSIQKDKLVVWSGKDYIRETKEGESNGWTGRILSIDLENNAAMAKIEIVNPENPVPFVDYLMLMKIEGKWTMIHKMFTTRPVSN